MRSRSLPFIRGGGVLTGVVFHVGVLRTVTFTIFGLSGSVSVSDHVLLGELLDDSKKISLLISTFGGGLVGNSESIAHSGGGVEHFSVSGNLLSGSSHDDTFLKDASVHVINVTRESGFKGSELSEGLLKVSRDGVVLLLEGGLSTLEGIEVDSDGTHHVGHHLSDSVNSGLVNEDIFLRSGHLGEEGDDWGVGVHDVDHGTGLDEVHGVLRELNEGGFTSDELVKEVHGTTEDGDGVLMSLLLTKESLVLGVSDGGELGEGRLGIDLVFLVDTKIDLGSGERGGAGSVMDLSSGVGIVTVLDFLGSEGEFLSAVSLLDSPHSVVLSLFSSDLFVESLDGVEDGSEWSTHGDLRLDLSEEGGVGELGHSLKSLFLDGRGVSGYEDNSEKSKNFH